MMAYQQSYVDTDVREVFKTHTVEQTQIIHKKINYEIERKREELRMLVGERYRDLIDAADTIVHMKSSSVEVFDKLSALRATLNGLPSKMTLVTNTEPIQEQKKNLTREELEIAVELKLCLDIPREIQSLVEKEEVIPALHLTLLFTRKLASSESRYKWRFLEVARGDLADSSKRILERVREFYDEGLKEVQTSYKKLTDCILLKHILADASVLSIFSEWLAQHVLACQRALTVQESELISIVGSTIQAIHQIFIDPDIYNTRTKVIRKFKLDPSAFGLRFTPRIFSEYNCKTIPIEEPPHVTQLARILVKDFISPLKQLLETDDNYLRAFKTLGQLQDYRKSSSKILKENCEELMRIVLGSSTNIWTEVFQPVFQRRAEAVSSLAIDEIIQFLRTTGFPKFHTTDSSFDHVGFIWKPSIIRTDGAPPDENLKIKCLTPAICQLCEDLEFRFTELLVDFQPLGDASVKEFISLKLLQSIDSFVSDTAQGLCATEEKTSCSLGRFVTGITELCPTLWKLLEKHDGAKLKQNLSTQLERCWEAWTQILLRTFTSDLERRMGSLTQENITAFMTMAEVYEAESGENGEKFVPSVRIPVEITHALHSLIFSICIEIAKVGPQCIPKSVLDAFRIALAESIIKFYDDLTQAPNLPLITTQMALQFYFDLKFVQWFHSSLSGSADSVVLKLRNIIDPFDWDIVNPRVTLNLKRFLFENQLTLGLLFSEESHGFIAQNFKTKQSLSFPTPTRELLYNQLPLLPV